MLTAFVKVKKKRKLITSFPNELNCKIVLLFFIGIT